ncbi:phage baseplate assembly protein V [Solwaraspora sp. WMMB335]|uniref:phage baseplate assembly protein V n=1 Tax=Solwaraspora sp. WMMB335 TaxID=3404118 RepID=UPI003B94DE14
MGTTAIPRVLVTVDGRPWGVARVLAMRVISRLAEPARCELTGYEPRGGWPAGVALGAELRVYLGDESDPVFDGDVTGIELVRDADAAVIRMSGADPLHRLARRRSVRALTDLTVAGLAESLIEGVPATVDAAEPGPRVDRRVQLGDDLSFLVASASAAGLYPVLRRRRLRLITINGHGPAIGLRAGESLYQARVAAGVPTPGVPMPGVPTPDGTASPDGGLGSGNAGCTEVTAFGWHPQRAEPLLGHATAPGDGRQVAGRRPAAPPGTGTADTVVELLVDQAGRTDAELTARAQATLDRRGAAAQTVSGTATGDTRLWAGRQVDVSGLGSGADGRYVLSTVVHTVDGSGFHTAVDTAPPTPSRAQTATALTLGVVTSVADPDRLGRVRVSLPGYGDLDAGWLAVLCPGAGRDKGIVALPDVADSVVVALPHQRPTDGIVLGGVYGMVAPPDTGVDGDAVRRWSVRTPGGQAIVVDDAENRVTVTNRAGSVLELGADRLRLRAATDVVIEAPGKSLTFRADSIDFEHSGLLPGGL